jgi:hypothetical protein
MSKSPYKAKIKQKGLKLNWVAMQVCVSRPTLSAYLAGTRNMPLDVESRLKSVLQ